MATAFKPEAVITDEVLDEFQKILDKFQGSLSQEEFEKIQKEKELFIYKFRSGYFS